MSKHSDQSSHCQGEICDAQGVKLHDDASSAATMSTIFMAGGIALAGAGVVLFLTAPKKSAPSTGASIRLAPSVGPNARGMTVVGRF
jgi:hypothetical protein